MRAAMQARGYSAQAAPSAAAWRSPCVRATVASVIIASAEARTEVVAGAINALRLSQPVLGLPTAVAVMAQTQHMQPGGESRFMMAQAKQLFMAELGSTMPPL